MKIKKLFWIVTLVALLAAGCASSTETTESPAQPEISRATELLVGTWKLDGTENDITAEQAAELLPLWQLFSTLSVSDTTAPAELDALVRQIESLMTDEQLAAIDAMDIQPSNMRELMTELGISGGQGDGSKQPPEGMAPGQGQGRGAGGGGGGGGANLSPEQIATAEARRAERAASAAQRVPGPLMNAFLEYLQSKAGK